MPGGEWRAGLPGPGTVSQTAVPLSWPCPNIREPVYSLCFVRASDRGFGDDVVHQYRGAAAGDSCFPLNVFKYNLHCCHVVSLQI